jgi:hypothetical protein
MRLVGAFAPKLLEEEITSKKHIPLFQLGRTISRKELEEKLRSGLLAECMEGFIEDVPKECDDCKRSWEQQNAKTCPPDGCDREFVFNSKSKGWHYGFLGSKKDSNVWHVWSVFALEPTEKDPDMFSIVARLDSPPFQLFCRRRNRGPLAKSRLEKAQRLSAVNCKCIYLDSTPDEIAAANSSMPVATHMLNGDGHQSDSGASSDSSSSSRRSNERRSSRKRAVDESSSSPAPTSATKSAKKSRHSSSAEKAANGLAAIASLANGALKSFTGKGNNGNASSFAFPAASQLVAAAAAVADAEPDRRMEMVLDLVRRVQLPGSATSTPAGGSNIAAAARRTAHSSLVLAQGQDPQEFGEHVLKLAKHWKKMDLKGIPVPVQQAQTFALHSAPDDLAPPFASFLLGQQEFVEHVLSLANWVEKETSETPNMQTLKACDRMLWMMQRQVIAVQRLRSEMRMMTAPSNWQSVVSAQTPASPMPAGATFPLSLQQELLPSSPLLGLSALPMTPYLMNQLHRRRMGSNTSTGSDPSMMMTDFDLEWFSKSLDALHAEGGAPTL